MSLRQVVVVGASAAGTSAARALRRAGFDGTVTMIGEERHRPYRRPPLSKQCLLQDEALEDLDMPLEDALQIEMRLETQAVQLDPRARRVHTRDGASVHFDGLVVASGARPRSLPGLPDVEGLHVLRTVDDCDRIRAQLQQRPKVVVIGGGFIGTEIAAAARSRGLDVTLVEGLPSFFANTLGASLGRFVADLHQRHGTQVRVGVPVHRVLAADRVTAVELQDGTVIDADLIVVGVGVTPATDWLEGSGLPLNNGVVCDATCTIEGATDMVAAGDVARWFHPRYGEYLRVEHWDNAIKQGAAAARRLLGDLSPFAALPYFWSDQFDVKIQFLGVGRPTDSIVVLEGDPRERRFVANYVRKGVVVGTLLVNSADRLGVYRRLLAG